MISAHTGRAARLGLTGAIVALLVPAAAISPAPAAAHPEPAEKAAVRFLTPRNLATVVGPSTVELEIRTPAAVEVVRVEVKLDGRLLGTLTSPPWKLPWDAGDGSSGHRLVAAAYLSDGTAVRAAVRTMRLRVTQVEEVALVNLYVVVRDADGHYVPGLKREDFRVEEDGRPQTIERFSTERKPLRAAIVLDTSLTMEGSKLDAAKKAAAGFLDALRPDDQAMVVGFSDEVRVLQPLTDQRELLVSAIAEAEAEGGTALYDAIYRTSRQLAGVEGRRVMILLSDGHDEAASGLEPGSLHTLREALDRALHDEVMIFSIGFGKNLDDEKDFYRRRSLRSILEELATRTGGNALFSKSPGRLKRAFEAVAEELRNQYSLAYQTDNPRRDGAWRTIRVTTVRPGLTVTTREGYYAPTGPPGKKRNVRERPPVASGR